MNPSNGSSSRTSSTPATTSLRPRIPRLISGFDEGDDPTIVPFGRAASPLPSPFEQSRAASPIPCPHPSRPASALGRGTSQNTSAFARINGSDSTTLSNLWGNSWTALQGIASDLLGTDTSGVERDQSPRKKKPTKQFHTRSGTSAPPAQWGPSATTPAPATSYIGTGSREVREALVRAQKRKEILSGREPGCADALGRFKRRTSEDRGSASAPPGDHEDRDALAYLHHVKPEDTLAGITIRYNCSAANLRKANRMWPNDTVQSRKTLVLPVDVCGVKGKPVKSQDGVDLLTGLPGDSAPASDNSLETQKQSEHGSTNGRERSETNSTVSDHPSNSSVIETEPPWKHDSWVLFPGSTQPTEIVRLSRRSLAYFPPARRKSQSYSDLDTPSTSLDLVRHMASPSLSPVRQDAPQRPRRSRRLSNANNGYFPSYLAGPGGVGTMNKNVKSPGPAQDGLNKLFASHLPNVAPPANQQRLYLPDVPLYSDDTGTNTPTTSGAQTPSAGVNFENLGAAVEGWVKKMASKGKEALQQPERERIHAARASVGMPGRGAGGIGDLIEMADAFEIGGDEEEEEEASRGRHAPENGRPIGSGSSYGRDALKTRGRSGHGDSGKRTKDD